MLIHDPLSPQKALQTVFAGLFSYLYANNTRALRIIFPEKPFNPALIRITTCKQTVCECIVGISNPSLMTGWACTEIGRPFPGWVDRTSYKHLFLRPRREARFEHHYPQDSFHYPQDSFYYQQDNFSAHIREFLLQTL